MGLETLPEIESFHKLPRSVIVKAGSSTYDERQGATLRGIVINNSGHAIRDIWVRAIILDEQSIPVMSTGVTPEPGVLHQGGIASFSVQVENYARKISNCHLTVDWKFDDRE